MDKLQCMQVFVRVVESGAFIRAADELGKSRASVTTAVADLERQLGVRLLNRTTRHLSLTDEGRFYYQACVRVLGEIAEAEDRVSATRLSPRGRLRVAVPQSFDNEFVYAALTRFSQICPQLELEVITTDRVVNLVDEGIDCALRATAIAPDSGLVARRLSAVHWVTVASPGYLAAHGTPQCIQDLEAAECIGLLSPFDGRVHPWSFIENGATTSLVPNGKLCFDSLSATCATAIADGGFAQVPDTVACRPVLHNELEPVLVEHLAPAPPLVIVYPGNRYLTARVRSFTDFCLREFPADGWWPRMATPRSLPRSA